MVDTSEDYYLDPFIKQRLESVEEIIKNETESRVLADRERKIYVQQKDSNTNLLSIPSTSIDSYM